MLPIEGHREPPTDVQGCEFRQKDADENRQVGEAMRELRALGTSLKGFGHQPSRDLSVPRLPTLALLLGTG